MIGRGAAVTQLESTLLRSELDDWPVRRTCACIRDSRVEAMPVTASFQCPENTCARKSKRRYRGLTICYREPPVLFFHLEFVPQYGGVWVLRIIHLSIRVVRRLYTLFNLRFLWGGSRHDVGRIGAGSGWWLPGNSLVDTLAYDVSYDV